MNDENNLGYEALENNNFNKIDVNNHTNEKTNLMMENKNNDYNILDSEKGIGHTYTSNNSKLNSHSNNIRKYGSLKYWYFYSNNEEPSIVLGPHCKNYKNF